MSLTRSSGCPGGAFATPPQTVAPQPPPCTGFSRQEHWSGLPGPPAGGLPGPGTEPGCPACQAESVPSEPPGKPLAWFTALGQFQV